MGHTMVWHCLSVGQSVILPISLSTGVCINPKNTFQNHLIPPIDLSSSLANVDITNLLCLIFVIFDFF